MKFSIRDLLLVTMIVALAVGWWVDHRRQAMKTNSDAWTTAGLKAEAHFRDDEIQKLKHELGAALAAMPTSSAPAPNPPQP